MTLYKMLDDYNLFWAVVYFYEEPLVLDLNSKLKCLDFGSTHKWNWESNLDGSSFNKKSFDCDFYSLRLEFLLVAKLISY